MDGREEPATGTSCAEILHRVFLTVDIFLCAGGQKSKQEKKEAHKAKRKAKKGDNASAATTALLNSTPTAEALAAVGANQMSNAAAKRQAEIDKNKIAWQQRRDEAGACPAVDAASGAGTSGKAAPTAGGDAAGFRECAGDAVGAHQHVGDANRTQNEAKEGQAGEAPASSGSVGDETDGSTSTSEEEEEVDVTSSGQVLHLLHLCSS